MKHRSCGNAALLAFAAHLLNVDVVSSSSSSSAASSRPSLLRRPASASSSMSPPSRRSLHCAFVTGGGSSSVRSSNGRTRTSPSPLAPSSSRTIWKQRRNGNVRNVSARLTKRVDTVAPRHYVEEGEAVDLFDEVLFYRDPNLVGEFSLLRPNMEFNELYLHELSLDVTSAQGGRSSSQLYEEFEEVEIGHFRPAASVSEGDVTAKATITNNSNSNNSPFFFASHQHQDNNNYSNNMEDEEVDSIPLTLPPWLSLNQARFAPMKLRKLQRDLTPHLSSKDIGQVTSAIYLAAGDDSKKVSGAADFCSILVNSLEMTDAPALCAAAFHYSSLVSVRERELGASESCSVDAESECLHTAGSDAKYLCALAGSGIENFGTHSVKIALDAARLKSMETLAATVVRKNGKVGPLSSADAKNLRSLLLTVNEEGDWRALAIRSAACLYRLEGLEAYRTLLLPAPGAKRRTRVVSPEESRASQEALHIYAPLAARLGMFRLKTELEDAAFRTLYPRSHAKVSALCGGENTNSVGEGMKSVLDDITYQMKRLVQEDCSFMENIENVSVTARVKEPYSVWRKMLKISRTSNSVFRDLSILDIPDAVATRVVFKARKLTPDEPDATTAGRERELCYYLFDLCAKNWPEASDSRFKDYVKNPKENGYQSLHYSSRKRWRGTEWPFEVQIRSKEMHRVAEYGVAAHWSYKRNDLDGDHEATNVPLDPTSEAYLKSVQEWQASDKRKKQQQSLTSSSSSNVVEPTFQEEIRKQRKRERDETLAPYLEALSGAQTDMTRENVFVFVSVQPPKEDHEGLESSTSSRSTAEGTVLSLPAGSRVLDAIRVTEKWSSKLESTGQLYDGRNSFVALCNGLRTSSLGTEMLSSGDVISILPSEDLMSSALLKSRRRKSGV